MYFGIISVFCSARARGPHSLEYQEAHRSKSMLSNYYFCGTPVTNTDTLARLSEEFCSFWLLIVIIELTGSWYGLRLSCGTLLQ